MKKIFILTLSLFFFSRTGFAQQPQAYESRLEYQKTMQQVAAIDIPYQNGVTEDAINEYMSKKGFKGSGSKGFTLFRGVKLDETDTTSSDLYFKIERKKKDRDFTVITLLATRTNMDILTRPTMDSSGQTDKAKAFLNNLVPYIDEHNTDVEVGKQQEVIKKNQKKINGLITDSTDLEKKIRNLLSDQAQNKSDILAQTSLIQNNVSADLNVKNKDQKKMNKLLDEQDNIAKKLRKAQADLGETKTDLTNQYKEADRQQQILDAIRAKKKMS
jgi:hypothetical protein